MKATLTITKVLALICIVHSSEAAKKWNDLKLRFDFFKSRAFYEVPLSNVSALMKDYVKVQPEVDFPLPLDFYCYPNDPRACLMFDKQGNVAGVQTSFLKADVANVSPEHYNYSAVVNFKETNFFGIPAYSFRTYFANPEELAQGGRQNLTETADGVWVYLEGQLFQIPRHQPASDIYANFHKQGCLHGMGVHYFYKISETGSDCKESFPLFALYDDGDLVGYGLASIGKGSKGPAREWYEHPPWLALSFIVPHRPQCFNDLSSKYGLTSMHVYLVDKPWDISCSFFGNVISAATNWIPLL